MPNVIDRSRAEALIREQVVSTIFQDAPKQSVVMQLGRKLPNMTSKQTRIPVLSMLPLAYWVNGHHPLCPGRRADLLPGERQL